MWNKNISDLLDLIQDDSVTLRETNETSARRVRELTLARLHKGQGRRRGPAWGKAAAAVALAAVLTTTALAVGVSQGWVHFFRSEEDVVQAAISGTEGDTAGHSSYGGDDYEELQSIQEMADIRLEALDEGETVVAQAQGTPSDGWTRMRTTECEENGRLRWNTNYQADALSALNALWDTGLDLTWVEERYEPNPGASLATFHRAAGKELTASFYAELIGEYRGEDGQIFNLQYIYRRGSEPVDQYRLVDGYCEYYTTRDGVQAAIVMETSHTGKSVFWVTVSAGETRLYLGGTQVELEEIHAILDHLDLASLT